MTRRTDSENDAGSTSGTGSKLANIRLLADLDPETLREVEAACRWQSFRDGEQILSRDSDNRDVFFVVKGGVRVVNHSIAGREIAFATLQAGSYFGELAAIDAQKRSASVVALDDCTVGILPAEGFERLVREHAEVAFKVIRKMAMIIRACDERIMDLAVLSAHQRVYRELLKMMTPDPVRQNSWLVYPLPTQAQIASHAGTTRETVARVLSQLTQSELVSRKGRTLYIRDPDTLRDLTERLAGEDRDAAR